MSESKAEHRQLVAERLRALAVRIAGGEWDDVVLYSALGSAGSGQQHAAQILPMAGPTAVLVCLDLGDDAREAFERARRLLEPPAA